MQNQSFPQRGAHLLARLSFMCCALGWFLAPANIAFAQNNEDPAQRRLQLQQMQSQLRDEIKQKSQMLYSVSLAQSQDDAAFRRQESHLISLRTQEGEVQRLLIKAELKVIEASIKVEVCPEAAPDKRVVQAELRIAEAERRFLNEKADAIHRSMDLCIEQMKSRTVDLDGRRAEIEQLQAKEQRVTTELDRLNRTARAASTIQPTVTAAAQ